MDENILEIIDRIKHVKGLRDDDEVASCLGMTKGNLSSYKTRQAIPFEYLSKFCRQEGLSLDWLLTGEGPIERGIYNKEEEKPSTIAEEGGIYRPERERIGNILIKNGAVKEEDLQKALEEQRSLGRDPDLDEIIDILKYDLPEAKRAILRLLKYRKGIEESIQTLISVDKPLKEER